MAVYLTGEGKTCVVAFYYGPDLIRLFTGRMASHPTALPTAAQVGKAFVSQYYNVLHNTPHVAHRFYTDASTIIRAEFGPNGVAETVATQAEIHEKLVSSKYGECKAEIKTVDSLDSLSGSVFLIVTGTLSRNNTKRNFVQGFFLAPQQNGYYVLNDIYRYLDDEPQVVNQIDDDPSDGLETVSEIPVDDHHEGEERDLSPSSPPEEVLVTEDVNEVVSHPETSEAEDEPPAEEDGDDEIPETATNEPEPETSRIESPPSPAEDVSNEKRSYASILLVKKESGGGASPSPKAPSRQPQVASEQQPSNQQIVSALQPSSVPTPENLNDSAEADIKGAADQRSIYVRNLPYDITSSQLEVEFMRFGRVKPNIVNVRSQKQGPCYGFVEFEEASSAQAAIEASPIFIFGRPAFAEEKRPISSRASNAVVRGRGLQQGREFFRNDGGRGRGSYGWGFARGVGQDRDYRGRGPGPMLLRGNYSGSSSNYSDYVGNSGNFNSYRRPDAQGVNINRPFRRGAGNQMPRYSQAAGT